MDLNPSSSKKLAVEPVKCSIPEMEPFTYNLIDDCVNILFDNLPLEDLLHCNLVCRQWYKLYRIACSRRRRLTLIIAYPPEPPINGIKLEYCPFGNAPNDSFANWDDKLSPIRHSWLMRTHGKLDHRLVYGLMRNLVNITTLEIILTKIPLEALDHVTQLLHFWSQKLISLKLWFCLEGIERTYTCQRETQDLHFIDAINSLSKLTHLTLSCESIYTKDSKNVTILQLENLREFNFYHISFSENVCKSICRYAESNQNLRFGFGMWFQYIEHLDLLFSYSHQVASQITQLCLFVDVIDIISDESLLTRFSEHFSNLTKLNLFNNTHSIVQCIQALSRFPHLTHLELVLALNSDDPSPSTKEQITQLESIRILSTQLYTDSHLDLQTGLLPWVFPNLEKLHLKDAQFDCDICGWERCLVDRKYSSEKRYDSCRKLLLRPLKEFEHLKVVKYHSKYSGNVFYSKEDL